MFKIKSCFSQACYSRLTKLVLSIIVFFICCVLLFRVVPVPFSSYMLQQAVQNSFNSHYHTRHQWVSLDQIAPSMQLAVIAAEDQKFPKHWGFDLDAIEKAIKRNQSSKRTFGASTISQQTAKNLFLWSDRSWLRKGLEIPITLSLELFWSKKRILEVYLNIAEFTGNPLKYSFIKLIVFFIAVTFIKVVITKTAFFVYAAPAAQKHNFPRIFFFDYIVSFHKNKKRR